MKTSNLSLIILLIFSFTTIVYGSEEIDRSIIADKVIDGVTFGIDNQNTFKLADLEPTCTDIDNSTGYISAKNLLASLILNKNVYLDIDNMYTWDFHGTGNRTVCVAYVDFNSTHYLNVNKVLINRRLVVINDNENDFNPEDWSYFVKKQLVSEFSLWIIPGLLVIFPFVIKLLNRLNRF